MSRRIIAGLATFTTVALAACGASEEGKKAAIQPEAARAKIERAAHVKLAAEPVPADAREQGLEASYSNTATAVADQQVVGLFVVEDAQLADEVSDMVRQSAPKSAKLIVDGNVMVVYAAAGADRSAALEKAVKAL